MKISARNQFSGIVEQIIIGAVNAEVHIRLADGAPLVAAITKESVDALQISCGMTIAAFLKASHILLVTDFGGYRLSARNQLTGKVLAIKPGQVNTEVELMLSSGTQMTATITHDSVENIGLRKGQAVTAVFKASSVILAVPAADH